jgi:hypothetical protein
LEFLIEQGISADLVAQLPLVGISGICNLIAAIKTARYYELDGRDVLFTPLTDSMDMYQSRIDELHQEHGAYNQSMAGRHFERYVRGIGIDHMRELNYYDRKSLHNFKYFTWVEQQGKTVAELDQLWDPDFWVEAFGQLDEWDRLIEQFNQRTGIVVQ